MSDRSLGIGLVGVGHHGLRYARHLLADVPGAHLAAVCRRRPGAPLDLRLSGDVPVHADHRRLVADPRVDAVVAVVPPALTPEICAEAARARKPVLIEKPLAASAAGARRMVDAAAGAGIVLMTAQTMRFDATVLALKDARADVGAPRYLSLTSRIPIKGRAPDHAQGYGYRGVLLEVGVHLTDLARFLTEEEVVEARCELDRLPPDEPDTLATATLWTASGLPCFLEVARVAAGTTGRAEWIGAEGLITADFCAARLSRATVRDAAGAPSGAGGAGGAEGARSVAPRPTVAAVLSAFVASVRDGTPPPVTGEDGLRAVELVEACYRSAEQGGRPVRLPAPSDRSRP